ncbi:MAG: pyridoxamine 5'-phosphate oxidase family protein [Pseudomonadales bacterium]
MSLSMSVTEREAFLAALHVGVVSIARPDRGPLTVPIWYDYTPGETVWMITNENSIKGRLLQGVSRISLCAQTEAPPYQYVSVEGPYSIEPSTDSALLAMAQRYLGEEMGKAYAAGAGDESGSVIVRLQPEHWLTVDYGKR